MSKKALIFGCSGQDGSFLAKSLIHDNYEVFGVSRYGKPDLRNHISLKIDKNVEFNSIDLSKTNALSKLIEKVSPDEIYNLCGQSSVGKSFNEPLETYSSIVDISRNILESSRLLDYKGDLFFAGSGEIYGETKQRATINSKVEPKSPYAIAKYASFQLVKLYRDSFNIKCKTGILFNHESSLRNENFFTHKLINGAIECIKNKQHKFRLGNLSLYRDWGSAEEYVEAIRLVNTNTKNNDHVICTGIETSLEEIVEIVFSILNLTWQNHIIIDKALFRLSDVKKSIGDPSIINNELGWKAKKTIKDVITEMIDSYLNKMKI